MKHELGFDPPLMNAAGSLGFAPERRGAADLAHLGAFVTNPVSLAPRNPALGVRFLSYPGGFLLHTGHPNPGLKTVIRRYADRWARSPLSVIVHLLCQEAGEVAQMVTRLEGLVGVEGVELGLPPQVEARTALEMIRAAEGELPVMARLPLERALELAVAIATAASSGLRVTAVSLGPPRGALPAPRAGLAHGRLYGPAIFPLALATLRSVRQAGLLVIGAGGVYRVDQIEAMLAAGAMGVQLDSVLWRGGW